MPIYQFDCNSCGETKDALMKYEEREQGLNCECGSHMDAVLTTCRIKVSGSGRITPPDVGPMSKTSKAYQKKQDDENSKFYAPDKTFGDGGLKGHKARQIKHKEMKKGKTNFTK